jgi:DNA-binding transcriptional ArsR family regulator
MIRYELAGMDLAEVRFAVSPLLELVLSLRAWRDPGRYPLQLRWLRTVQEARSRLDAEMLLALTNDKLWTPDFLTPRPYSPLTRLEEELALLRRVEGPAVARDLRMVHPEGPLPKPLRGPPERVLARILDALDGYWRLCYAPHWPRMCALLEADVTYRGRQIAQQGLAEMFAGLAETVRLVGNVVEVRLRSENLSYTRPTRGGLTLVPTMWTRNSSAPISPDEPPTIMYPARGVGTLWEAQPMPAPDALAGLIGGVRAGLLAQLGTPASSTELAARLDVTPAAVNQHLRALRAAGLLVSARHGRSVLYRRSDLGDRLLAGSSDHLLTGSGDHLLTGSGDRLLTGSGDHRAVGEPPVI